MKIPVRNQLRDLIELREVVQLITAELLQAYSTTDLDKCSDIYNLQCIEHRLQQKILSLSHRGRDYNTNTWLSLPELATVSRVVELYCFQLPPYYQVVLRENYYNRAYLAFISLHNTRAK